jgi:hypothetical protein
MKVTKEFIGKLTQVQKELKAPKSQYNSFGKYHYRNLEDIFEALKPILFKLGLFASVEDSIELIGERYYVKATATITDGESSISSSSFARESFDKKGMDDSQITGAASSYARKYALNGLLGIDDTKDADTKDNSNKDNSEPFKHLPENTNTQVTAVRPVNNPAPTASANNGASEKQISFLKKLGYKGDTNLSAQKASEIIRSLQPMK